MKKTKFDLTYERRLTMKPDGTLYPIMCERCIPGDVWKGEPQIFGRMLPLINPVYQRFDLFVHAFFVPDRLVWMNFREWIAPEYTGNQSDQLPTYPAFKIRYDGASQNDDYHTDEDFEAGTLADHLGIQLSSRVAGYGTMEFSSLPFRAYQLIWNEHYRDADMQEPLNIIKSDGFNDDVEGYQFQLRKRNYEKDYFNSAKPFAQKGDPTVVMTRPNDQQAQARDAFTNVEGIYYPLRTDVDGKIYVPDATLHGSHPVEIDTRAEFSIADLRWANAFQMFKEKLYRVGSRYPNMLKYFYGVKSSDGRLDRPEFIGGGRQPFVISEVLQTSQSDDTPLGTYGGHGVTSGKSDWNYRVEEHGQILVLVSVMPRVSYMNTIRRQMFAQTPFDYPMPDFANLGSQPIKNAEIQASVDLLALPDETWGYQERYAEYKFIPSTTHGAFRSDVNLQTFHCARPTDEATVLDENFIHNVPGDGVTRIFAQQGVDFDPILLNCIHRVSAVRSLPKFSFPHL